MKGPRTAADWVAIILAVAVGLTLFTFSIAASIAVLAKKHAMLSDIEVGFLTATTGAVIGALSTYLGLSRSRDTRDDDPPDA